MLLIFGDFVFSSTECLLRKNMDVVPLSPKALRTLELLLVSKGRVVTKQEFMETLWPDSFVEESSLTQNIFVLRKTLGLAPDGKPYIETVARRGYRFAISVAVRENEPQIISSVAEPVQESTPLETPEQPPAPSAVSPSQAAPSTTHTPHFFWARLSWQKICLAALLILGVILGGRYVRGLFQPRVEPARFVRLTNDGRLKNYGEKAPLITDGKQIFFTEAADSENLLAQVSTDGGEPARTPAPIPDGDVIAYLPQTKELLFGATGWSDRSLVSLDLAGGKKTVLSNIRAHDAEWSADGRKLAYTQGETIFVWDKAAKGENFAPLARAQGLVYWPRWSPDGRRLRFSENFDGNQDQIWEVDADGNNLHKILQDQDDRNHVCCGSWMKENGDFIYLSIGSNSSDICIARQKHHWWDRAERVTRIPAAPLDRWRAPLPGPDGKHVLAIGDELHGRLVRINPQTRLPEPYLDGISAEGVSFSPDGTQIAFTAYPEGSLWRSRVDGTQRVQLARPPLLARFPRWSPDGKTIVFLACQAGSNWRLYTVPSAGGTVQPLLQREPDQGVANWSPDGKYISFGHLLDYVHDGPNRLNIEILNLKDNTTSVVPGSEGLWTARWSPDGRFLSAVTGDNKILRLYDMQSGQWSDIANGSINDVAWSPDGNYIFFDTASGNTSLIYRIDIKDKKVEQWASLRDFRRAGYFSPWLGMSPDGSPLLLEDSSLEEIYSIALR